MKFTGKPSVGQRSGTKPGGYRFGIKPGGYPMGYAEPKPGV